MPRKKIPKREGGQRSGPPPSVQEFEESWSGDRERQVKGTRQEGVDAVQELGKVPFLTGPVPGESGVDEMPTEADQNQMHIDAKWNPEELSEEELKRRAAALSIPGRERMSKLQLVEAVRETFAKT